MRILHEVTPKEKRDEIVAAYLCGDNSYEELGQYYGVNPSNIRMWVCRHPITADDLTIALVCRHPMSSTSRQANRKRCGRTKFIAGMSRVFRLIPNFADDNSCCCQSFQEKDNLFSEGVNDSSKVSTCSVKRLSTTSGNRVKTVNQNQEKTGNGYMVTV